MNTLKQWLLGLVLFTGVCSVCHAEVEWLTDVNAAKEKARAENKIVLLDFTGSDWCGWCMKLKGEVFDQPEFASFAQQHLVMVEVDFPRGKKLSPEQTEANRHLAVEHGIRGYPTIILLNAAGERVGETGYVEGGPRAFIAQLQKVPGIGSPAAPVVAAREEPVRPRREVQFVPIAPVKPNHYEELALKAISGPKNHRLVLINNETLGVGETAKVRVKETRVEVTCKEIHDDSVVLMVEGKSLELKLRQ